MKRIASVAIASVMLVAVTAGPVSAQGYSTDQSRQESRQAQTAQEETQRQQGITQEEAQQRGQAAQESAQQRKERIQQQVEERRSEVKQQVCERKQEQLQQVIPKLATQSRALKDAMDRVYENVQGFVESEQVVVEGYEERKSSVDAAQADAEAAVQVVEDYEFELDCDTPSVGEQLDGFRTAVEEARQELQTYRDELVHLIQEMRAEEADSAEDQEENGQESGTNGADSTADEGEENAQ